MYEVRYRHHHVGWCLGIETPVVKPVAAPVSLPRASPQRAAGRSRLVPHHSLWRPAQSARLAVVASGQALEVSEEKSLEREDILQKQIKELLGKLKLADTRSENSEMDIGRLNVRIDKVEEDLVTEKSKIKQVSDDLNAVFEDLM